MAWQVVSPLEASLPAAFVLPAGQAVHALLRTLWFREHLMASQVVSPPDASSPAALVFPAGQAVHALRRTRWFAVQITFCADAATSFLQT
jgi:hypothetical protein